MPSLPRHGQRGHSSRAGRHRSATTPPDRWWELYGDPSLTATCAKHWHNTDLRAADANLRRASATVLEYRARGAVQADVDASGTLIHAGGYTQASAAPQSYALGLHLSYPLDLAGGIRRGIEAANADAEAVAAARDQVRVVVAVAVTVPISGMHLKSHARCNPAGAGGAARHPEATRRLAAGGRNGLRCQPCRCRRQPQRGGDTAPSGGTRQAALIRTAALMGRLPADSSQGGRSLPRPPELEQALVGDGWQLLQRRPRRTRSRTQPGRRDCNDRCRDGGSLSADHLGALRAWPAHRRICCRPTASVRASVPRCHGTGPTAAWPRPASQRQVPMQIPRFASFDGVVLQALRQTETALSARTQELERARSLAQARGDAARAAGRRSSSTVSAGSIFSTCFRPRPRWQMRSPHWPSCARSALTGRWIFPVVGWRLGCNRFSPGRGPVTRCLAAAAGRAACSESAAQTRIHSH